MKYKIKNITDYLDSLFPQENALSYDNPGLTVGTLDEYTDSVVVTLDCTYKTLALCDEKNSNLIISHHPMIFGGIKNVNLDTPEGRLVGKLIRHKVSLYACHTNLDVNEEFSNCTIAEALGYPDAEHLDGTVCGVYYELNKKDTLGAYAKKVTEALDASGVITINNPDNKVSKVFIQGGAFDEDSIPAIIENDIDLVISGEIKHHLCVKLEMYGISTIIAGHNATERMYLPKLKNTLKEAFPDLNVFVDFGNERVSL